MELAAAPPASLCLGPRSNLRFCSLALPPPPQPGCLSSTARSSWASCSAHPAQRPALEAARARALEVLAPGFEEACAAAEAAERFANPAAALPDDLFSDEPAPAARPPSSAERCAADAEAALEAAAAEARSLRAFLFDDALEAAEAALAALQQQRQRREQQVAAAAAAVAAAAAAPQLPAALAPLLPAKGHLAQLPLMQHAAGASRPGSALAAPAAAAAAAAEHHDGLSPENECVICMADVRYASPLLIAWPACCRRMVAHRSPHACRLPPSPRRRVLCVPCGHMCVCAQCQPLAQAKGSVPSAE